MADLTVRTSPLDRWYPALAGIQRAGAWGYVGVNMLYHRQQMLRQAQAWRSTIHMGSDSRKCEYGNPLFFADAVRCRLEGDQDS
jgi:hypothetical protein